MFLQIGSRWRHSLPLAQESRVRNATASYEAPVQEATGVTTRLGVFGGGWGGEMVVHAAHGLGCDARFHAEPAGRSASAAELRALAETVDVLTTTSKKVPWETLDVVSDVTRVRPSPALLRQTQDLNQTLRAPGDHEREFSVIVARSEPGEMVSFPSIENMHMGGMLDISLFPARIQADQDRAARTMARELAQRLGLVGVLCVEFYALTGRRVWMKRAVAGPHDSGSLTLEACDVSQYELHVRALAGLPLVEPKVRWRAAMANLVGLAIPNWPTRERGCGAAAVSVHNHREIPRPGLTTGHVTATARTHAEALDLALATRSALVTMAVSGISAQTKAS